MYESNVEIWNIWGIYKLYICSVDCQEKYTVSSFTIIFIIVIVIIIMSTIIVFILLLLL